MSEQQAANTPSNGSRKKKQFLILGAVVAVGLAAYTAYHLSVSRFYESTDDAYVASDLVRITNEVSGTITTLHVDDTQFVSQGTLLAELDPADAEVTLASAEANLASTVRSVRSMFATTKGLSATVEANQAALDSARKDLSRRQSVAKGGGVSAEELQHALFQVAQLEASLAQSTQALASNRAQIENTTVQTHPLVNAAAAKVREAALQLKRTKILAPVSGVVAQKSAQIGTRVAAGTPLMAVVPLDGVWIDANFKEVQLANMRVGQPVSVHADLYGSDVEFTGHVAGLGAGTGAAFALLPPQNASGNWIKVVQRVPVRIALDADALKKHPLRVGLSMHVEVDMHDTSGSLMTENVREHPQQVADHHRRDAQIEARIADIIAENIGEQRVSNAQASATFIF